jgi:hypothetical protein
MAEIFLSEYKVELPSKPLYVDRLHWWEHADGAIQYAGDGQFDKVALPAVPPVTDPVTPPDSGGSAVPADWEITIPSFKISIHKKYGVIHIPPKIQKRSFKCFSQ